MSLIFKIQIKGISKPPVWRKVEVPESITFSEFHEVIQNAFGWDDDHLYEFSPHGWGSIYRIGIRDEDDDYAGGPAGSSAEVRLGDIFKELGQKYTYIYDFGDSWEHAITLDEKTANGISNTRCLDGKGACPPEDCGGAPGFTHLRKVFADPTHDEYEDMVCWVGEEWDANHFDLHEADQRVSSIVFDSQQVAKRK